jgi:hypothetical protein
MAQVEFRGENWSGYYWEREMELRCGAWPQGSIRPALGGRSIRAAEIPSNL